MTVDWFGTVVRWLGLVLGVAAAAAVAWFAWAVFGWFTGIVAAAAGLLWHIENPDIAYTHVPRDDELEKTSRFGWLTVRRYRRQADAGWCGPERWSGLVRVLGDPVAPELAEELEQEYQARRAEQAQTDHNRRIARAARPLEQILREQQVDEHNQRVDEVVNQLRSAENWNTGQAPYLRQELARLQARRI